MTSLPASGSTEDFGDLRALDSISSKVGQGAYGSLHVRDTDLVARRQLCPESSSS